MRRLAWTRLAFKIESMRKAKSFRKKW